MSMNNTGASGYVVEAVKLVDLIPLDFRKDYMEAIDAGDTEAVDEILGENAPENFPSFESSFKLNDEDEADNLSIGVVYICFQDEDLYKPKELSTQGEFLASKGITPEFERWVTWG